MLYSDSNLTPFIVYIEIIIITFKLIVMIKVSKYHHPKRFHYFEHYGRVAKVQICMRI